MNILDQTLNKQQKHKNSDLPSTLTHVENKRNSINEDLRLDNSESDITKTTSLRQIKCESTNISRNRVSKVEIKFIDDVNTQVTLPKIRQNHTSECKYLTVPGSPRQKNRLKNKMTQS